jgi:hypothetical protein
MTSIGEVLQHTLHIHHLLDAEGELRSVGQREPLYLGARAPAVLPEAEQRGDLAHTEPQIAGATDEAQRVYLAVY